MSSPADHPNAAYPSWLPKPRRRVVVVIGPVAALSLGHADLHVAAGDLVIELGRIIEELSGEPAATAGNDWLVPALGRRNAALAALGEAADDGTAWFITAAPKPWQRAHWQAALAAELVVVDPGRDAALAAAADAGFPARFVHQWYAEAGVAGPVPTVRPRAYHSAHEGNTHRKLRDRQLAREPHCRMCKAEGRLTPATVMDHIEPFRREGADPDWKLWGDPRNHRSLCETHHNASGAKHDRAAKPPGAGADGRPLDAAHPWNRRS